MWATGAPSRVALLFAEAESSRTVLRFFGGKSLRRRRRGRGAGSAVGSSRANLSFHAVACVGHVPRRKTDGLDSAEAKFRSTRLFGFTAREPGVTPIGGGHVMQKWHAKAIRRRELCCLGGESLRENHKSIHVARNRAGAGRTGTTMAEPAAPRAAFRAGARRVGQGRRAGRIQARAAQIGCGGGGVARAAPRSQSTSPPTAEPPFAGPFAGRRRRPRLPA